MDEFLISMVGLQENHRLQTGIIIKSLGSPRKSPFSSFMGPKSSPPDPSDLPRHDLKDLAARTLVG
jgi:hypothetical protein